MNNDTSVLDVPTRLAPRLSPITTRNSDYLTKLHIRNELCRSRISLLRYFGRFVINTYDDGDDERIKLIHHKQIMEENPCSFLVKNVFFAI